MGSVFSFLWKMMASIATAAGLAAVARKFSEPPAEQPSAQQPASLTGRAAARQQELAEQGARGPVPVGPPAPFRTAMPEQHPGERHMEMPPGWSKPKPEKIPSPTYWPALFGFGVMFLAWGIISNVFLFSFGFILIAISFVGWIYDLRNEFPE